VTVVATAFAASVREELRATANDEAQVQAHYLARAGIQRALAEIQNSDTDEEPNSTQYLSSEQTWRKNPEAYGGVALGRGRYRVAVVDEESKLPLNRLPGQVLRRLVRASGVQGSLVDILVDSILDWRDPDTRGHRISGAKDDFYLGLPRPYRAKNGEFDTVEELLLVRGMTPAILFGGEGQTDDGQERRYNGIAQFLTVDSAGGVNLNTVTPEAIAALGFNEAEVTRLVARRTDRPFRHPNEVREVLSNQADLGLYLPILLVKSAIFRIDAEGELADGTRERATAIVQRVGVPRFGHLVILRWADGPRWREGVPAEAPPAGGEAKA
jgi:general secretion pathway protein K